MFAEQIIVPVPPYTGIIWLGIMAIYGVYAGIRHLLSEADEVTS